MDGRRWLRWFDRSARPALKAFARELGRGLAYAGMAWYTPPITIHRQDAERNRQDDRAAHPPPIHRRPPDRRPREEQEGGGR